MASGTENATYTQYTRYHDKETFELCWKVGKYIKCVYRICMFCIGYIPSRKRKRVYVCVCVRKYPYTGKCIQLQYVCILWNGNFVRSFDTAKQLNWEKGNERQQQRQRQRQQQLSFFGVFELVLCVFKAALCQMPDGNICSVCVWALCRRHVEAHICRFSN